MNRNKAMLIKSLKILRPVLVVIIFFCIAKILFAQNVQYIELESVGVYAEIDVKNQNEAIGILLSDDETKKEEVIKNIKVSSGNYNPAVLHSLAYVLASRNEMEEAAFWFYASQLRGRFDAARSLDLSAGSGVDVLNERLGPYINAYAFKDLDKFENLLAKIIQWDTQTPHNYDHRWIDLHGMNSYFAGMQGKVEDNRQLSRPEAEWKAIQKKTQDDFLKRISNSLTDVQQIKDNKEQENQ